MKYYVAEGTTPAGPFEIDQLRQRGLTPDTLVWAAGMTDWVAASTVDELQQLFEPVPPPLTPPPAPASTVDTYEHQHQPQPQPQPTPEYQPQPAPSKPFSWLWPSILITVCCCSPLAIVGIIYSATSDNHWNRGEYDEAASDAKKAAGWTIAGLVLGIIGNIISVIIYSLNA